MTTDQIHRLITLLNEVAPTVAPGTSFSQVDVMLRRAVSPFSTRELLSADFILMLMSQLKTSLELHQKIYHNPDRNL